MQQLSNVFVLGALTIGTGVVVTDEMAPDTTAAKSSVMNEVGHSVAPDIAIQRQSGNAGAPAAPQYTWGDAVRDVALDEAARLVSNEATAQLSPLLGGAFGARTGSYLSSSIVGVVSSLAYGEGFGSALKGIALQTAKQIGLDELRETPAGAVVASAVETAEAVQSFVGYVQACSQSGPRCLSGAPTQVRTLLSLGQSWKDTSEMFALPTLDLGPYGLLTNGDLQLGWYPSGSAAASTLTDKLQRLGYLSSCTEYPQGCHAAAQTLGLWTSACRQRCTREQLTAACAADDAGCRSVVRLLSDRDAIPCTTRGRCSLGPDDRHTPVAQSPAQLLTTLHRLVASGALPDSVNELVLARLPGRDDSILIAGLPGTLPGSEVLIAGCLPQYEAYCENQRRAGNIHDGPSPITWKQVEEHLKGVDDHSNIGGLSKGESDGVSFVFFDWNTIERYYEQRRVRENTLQVDLGFATFGAISGDSTGAFGGGGLTLSSALDYVANRTKNPTIKKLAEKVGEFLDASGHDLGGQGWVDYGVTKDGKGFVRVNTVASLGADTHIRSWQISSEGNIPDK